MSTHLLRILTFLFWANLAFGAHPLDVWHWRNPLPQGNPLTAVAYGEGVYVAVGSWGTVLASVDGTNWSRCDSGTFEQLNAVVFADNRFVAVGDYGAIITSPDGLHWTPQYGGTFFPLTAVTHGNSLYVAVGAENTILTSVDGTLWISRSSGPIDFKDIAFGNGVFVALGSEVVASPDGINWLRQPFAMGFQDIEFGAGQFVAVGNQGWKGVWTSTNGAHWEGRGSVLDTVDNLSYGSNKWMIVSRGRQIYVSDDLITWTSVYTNDTAEISNIGSGSGLFLATTSRGYLFLSKDAVTWSNPGSEPLAVPYLFQVSYANNQFVATSGKAVSFSSDGALWSPLTAITNLGEYDNLSDIAYGRGLYVATGNAGRMWISSDGTHWTNTVSLEPPYNADLNAVTYGDGLFVAAGYYGIVLSSPNGIDWTALDIATNEYEYAVFNAVAYGAGKFVVAGIKRAAVSTDGVSWHSTTFDWSVYLHGVAYGDGKFVAVGEGGPWVSADGTNWARAGRHPDTVYDIAFGGGYFVGVGSDFTESPSVGSSILSSPDGFNWTAHQSLTDQPLRRVAFGNSSFVAAGRYGAILQSDPLITLALSGGSQRRLTVSGPAERTYRIEGSDRGEEWWPLATVFAEDMPFTFEDTSATNQTRLYRAVLQP